MKRWIQKIIWRAGTLHRQLEIDKDKQIPFKLLDKIISAKAGDIIANPTKLGKRKIKVTRLLERRAILARNLKNISKKK